MNIYKINGKVVSEEEWNEGLGAFHYCPNKTFDGHYELFWQEGNREGLVSEHTIQNNKFHGLDRAWGPNGKLLYEVVWVDGTDRTEEFKNNKLLQVVAFGKVIL